MTRVMALVAMVFILAGSLSACVTGGGMDDVMDPNAVSDDAHCQSLLIRPGELVYAQCRLALRKTYLNDYAARKAAIAERFGPVTQSFDGALRADAFCNYDESVKQVRDGLADDVVAQNAYQRCDTTRNELAEKFAAATGKPGETLIELERDMILEQNRAAVREARAVIDGPPGSAVTTEAAVAERGAGAIAQPIPPSAITR
ncbi:hypothetical protein LQ948_00935 [Jiella sp. MQZ9-1]|uniref:Uncharacterized protein n=1 Tax=Jiella flava TaxID=2816857 RepID=A0A939FUP3_9HYPH|nr:hypothetical protein [Jiella flava]MBO0661126.1 hypothetical protein [Jiella flava]MCD2469772.1 hypothetical protein [Jiella flava]